MVRGVTAVHQDRTDLDHRAAVLVTATAVVPRIISVICRQASAHAESRLADDSATSVLLVIGAFLAVNHAAATDTTRPTAIPGLACV